MQSLLTGQLLIALDFFVPAGDCRGPPPPGEIPSVPSTLANLQRTIDQALMGAPEIASSLEELVASVRELLSSPTATACSRRCWRWRTWPIRWAIPKAPRSGPWPTCRG